MRTPCCPAPVEVGSYDGKFLVLNYTYTAYGIWYSDQAVHRQGLAVRRRPGTSTIALCKQIKAAGIAPWTYPGKHPRYMSWPLIVHRDQVRRPVVALAIDNLEPNAWKSDAMKAAADAWYQIVKDKYILAGSPGLDHIQSQTAWCQGKAAFISCGSWLENEQKKVTPAGFNMTVAPTPSLGSGRQAAVRGDPGHRRRAVHGAGQGQEPAPVAWSTCASCCPRRARRTSPGRSPA